MFSVQIQQQRHSNFQNLFCQKNNFQPAHQIYFLKMSKQCFLHLLFNCKKGSVLHKQQFLYVCFRFQIWRKQKDLLATVFRYLKLQISKIFDQILKMEATLWFLYLWNTALKSLTIQTHCKLVRKKMIIFIKIDKKWWLFKEPVHTYLAFLFSLIWRFTKDEIW